MLTHGCLPPPLTSTVKLSLFTHVHSSPLSLAARLHWCCTNHSHYINNGWAFSVQTSFLFLYFLKGVSYPDCLFPGPLLTSHATSLSHICEIQFCCLCVCKWDQPEMVSSEPNASFCSPPNGRQVWLSGLAFLRLTCGKLMQPQNQASEELTQKEQRSLGPLIHLMGTVCKCQFCRHCNISAPYSS